MSYNGSGTFLINTSGQPVVTGTPISSTVFNALTADLATGLSTAITKDGQTATTARIPFAQGISSTLVTDSTSTTTGSIITAGGAGVAKALFVGTTANVAGAVTLQSTLGVTGITTFSAQPIFSSLTASSAVATDASKGLVSVTNTGTGNNVLATSPTLVTPVLGAASATSVTVAAGAVGTPSITTTGDTNTGIFFPAADTIAFTEGGAEAMRITSTGDVGIGTSSPAKKLELYSSQNANVELLRLNNPDVNGLGTQIGFTQGSTTYSQIISEFSSGWRTKIGAGVPTGTTAGDAGYLTFFTNNGSSSYAERMRIDSSGNVGIGTTSPAGKLAVSDGTVIGEINPFSAASGCYIGTRSNHAVLFQVNASEKARIDSSGNLLVGKTSTATTTLGWLFGSDRGNAKFSAGNYFIFNRDDDDILVNFRRSDVSVGTITVTTTATAYNTSSDYRLKEDVQPMTGALAKVALLKPCTYKWKVDGSDGQGFIAHELQEVVEGCVTGAKDAVQEEQYEVTPAVKDKEGNTITEAVMGTRTVPAYQGIDTSFLVATLTAAIQEQQALITALTTRITALENK